MLIEISKTERDYLVEKTYEYIDLYNNKIILPGLEPTREDQYQGAVSVGLLKTHIGLISDASHRPFTNVESELILLMLEQLNYLSKYLP